MEFFGKQLRKRAQELGLSDAEVARRAGLSERRYGNYVSGMREPDLATLVRISKTLATTPDVLLGVTTDKAKKDKEAKTEEKIMAALCALVPDDKKLVARQVDALIAHRREISK